MFEASILLLIKALLINVLIPFVSGILFLWLFFSDKYKGFMIYILSFFIGTGVVAFSLFNLQFFHYGIGIFEYFFINILLLISLGIKIIIKKENCKKYLETLKIGKFEFKKSFFELDFSKKILFIFLSTFVGLFSLTAFIFNINFPTYADDSFGNWNTPAINIYYDGGVKMFGEENEILGRGRLGYPIYLPIYKALISDFFGGFNDIYINLWQFLVFLFFIIFVFYVTFSKTKNLFYSILPIFIICSLSLLFFHSVDGYYDLPCAIYSFFSIYFIYEFIKNNNFDDLALGLLFGFILSSIKNEGIIVYFAGILISFLIYLIISKRLFKVIKDGFKNKFFIFKKIFFVVYFFLPFILLKSYLGLGYNQAAGEKSGIGIGFHPEIFSAFPVIFFKEDNYNLILLFIGILYLLVLKNIKNKKIDDLFPILAGVMIFLIFLAVFLFTENYRFMLDQTTANRVFTMSFVVLFSFFGLLNYEKTI